MLSFLCLVVEWLVVESWERGGLDFCGSAANSSLSIFSMLKSYSSFPKTVKINFSLLTYMAGSFMVFLVFRV